MSSYVDIRHLCFMTPARTVTIIDKNHDICSDVNKTSTSVELLAIHVIRYISKRSNVGLGNKSTTGLKIIVEEWNGQNVIAHSLKFDELLQ